MFGGGNVNTATVEMNKINWFFLHWCFLIVSSTAVPDVTLVLQKLTKDVYNMTYILSGENIDSGIAWIQPIIINGVNEAHLVSKYVPDFQNNYSCDINFDCAKDWTNDYWNLRKSYFTNLDLVTDSRWEEFTLMPTNGNAVRPLYVAEFKENKNNKLTINFSIRVKNVVLIFLCRDSHYTDCYWILLNDFGKNLTTITKCLQHDGISSSSMCSLNQSITTIPDEILISDSWKHFTIAINKNHIVLKSISNNVTLLNYTDDANSYINIQYLFVKSIQLPAEWKFHNYDFTYSNTTRNNTETKLGPSITIQNNTLCISLYAAMCSQCNLIIKAFDIKHNTTILSKAVEPLKGSSWQKVKWNNMSFPTNGLEIQFYVETHCLNSCDEQFWALDDFRVCTENEVRVLNVKGNPFKSSFQMVDSPFINLNITNLTSQSNREAQGPKRPGWGTTCTTCYQVFGFDKEYCESSIICNYLSKEESICSHSPCYTGEAYHGRTNAPKELNYSWDNYYNLTLKWNHHRMTNGFLTKFNIEILKGNKICNRSVYMINKENNTLTYNMVIPIENKDCYTSELTVTIQSFNEQPGGNATLNIYSPPETPALSNISVESVSSTTITIALSAITIQHSKSFLYISLSKSNLESLYKVTYSLNTEVFKKRLTIGSNKSNNNNSSYNDTNNPEITLIPNTSYTITISMVNEYQGIKRRQVYKIVQSTAGLSISSSSSSDNSSIDARFLVLLVLVFLLLPLIWICNRKRKTGRWCSVIDSGRTMPRVRRNYNNISVKLTSAMSASPNPDAQVSPKNVANYLNKKKINNDVNSNIFSKVIKVTEFGKYVKQSIINGELKRQHSIFLDFQTKPLNYGYVIPNDSKNTTTDYDLLESRYEEIIYDNYSDNFNANYIEGYISKTAYVAIKCPTKASVKSFWRSIWQNDVKYIVMLSNAIEIEKGNNKQYWSTINEVTQFGNIMVKYVSIQIFADYEYRTFLISSNNEERQVEQLQFISWPDNGVPMYAKSLVPLFQLLLTIPEGNSPIVIHCTLGMEPIGTVILCDLSLKMAVNEEIIDILKYLRKIKVQRGNLIGSFEQYKLAHLVVLEYLVNNDTSITCDNEAVNNILSLFETPILENQFQYISQVAWQDQAMRPLLKVNEMSACKQKNRVQNILANGHGRVYLSRYPIVDPHSSYINAVEVDGFKAPRRFIVTQQPLPNTISDFWRMIDEKRVATIVSLNTITKENNRSCVFWPTYSINNIYPVPYLLIKFINKIKNEEFTIVNLELHNSSNKVHSKRDICLINLKNWPASQLTPNSNASLLNLWNQVQKLSQTEHPIVVTCYDGATACGLFVAFTFVIEKIKLEYQCDVSLAVRTVRHNREQFVSNLEQFKYLYYAIIPYLTSLQL